MVAIGVDTHKANLAACAIDERGNLVAERDFSNSPSGNRAFERWLQILPLPRRIGIEGSGSFGAGLAQRLAAAGEAVCKVPAILTYRERRRTGRPGKSDPADALAIARVVLREERLPAFRVRAHRDLKLLVDYREQLIGEQTRLRNRLHADLRVLVPGYGGQLGRRGDLARVASVAAARSMLAPFDGVAAELAERRLARVEILAREISALDSRLVDALAGAHPALTTISGVGPLIAARLLGETGDVRRFHSSAAFAMACGVAPIPASSGNTQRVRLSRRGNRQLNRALFTVAFTQARCYAPAHTYMEPQAR